MTTETKTATSADPTIRQQRNRMAGLWAAELLGLLGKAAKDYAHDVVHAHDHDADGDEKLAERLNHDLRGRVGMHEIREKLSHLLHEARRQLHHGDKS
ncbi:MAG: hypothetical protein BGO92_20115 [Magnetospirillum sp. 64-120]|nr:MAG: hypothetical protein BGO92_20115 [Magnetospirillum sp. 64-120]